MIRSFILFFTLLSASAYGQPNSLVWGSPVLASDNFNYSLGVPEPPSNWRNPSFNDASWLSGPGGFGYGDGDDQTILQNSLSVLVRNEFQVSNKDSVAQAYFHVDYDDGFVAYLNGIEIARNNVDVTLNFPVAATLADANHEASMYQGGLPEEYIINKSQLQSILVNGKNVLAVQVHNVSSTSSDLSCLPFLTFGINASSNPYSSAPAWFTPSALFSESHLPIVIVNTGGQAIIDDPEIVADMSVIYNGPNNINYTTDNPNNYLGKINIETRGESSLFFYDKKSYKVETVDASGANLNVSLMGFPKENDWIFYGPYGDKSLLRNVLTFELAQSMNSYASKTQFFELVIDGDYKGLYLLMEKIKQDKNRLDIAKLNPQDTSAEEITGGYILRLDKEEPTGSPGFFSYPNPAFPNYGSNYFQFYDPDFDDFSPPQVDYIKNYLYQAESALSGTDFLNTSNGYKKYFDLPSFADYQIINELTKNVDGYRYSTYFHKDKNDVIKAGPFWDFNLAYGNVDYWDHAYTTDGWIYPGLDRLWWTERMLEDYEYVKTLHCQWNSLRQNEFSNASIIQKIDSLVDYLGPAIDRNFERWKILGAYVWPNKFIGADHDEEVQFLKTWMTDRADWLDNEWTIPCPLPPVGVTAPSIADVTIYPNPFADYLLLENIPQGITSIQLNDALGQVVLDEHINKVETHQILNTKQLTQGLYFLTFLGESSKNSARVVKLK